MRFAITKRHFDKTRDSIVSAATEHELLRVVLRMRLKLEGIRFWTEIAGDCHLPNFVRRTALIQAIIRHAVGLNVGMVFDQLDQIVTRDLLEMQEVIIGPLRIRMRLEDHFAHLTLPFATRYESTIFFVLRSKVPEEMITRPSFASSTMQIVDVGSLEVFDDGSSIYWFRHAMFRRRYEFIPPCLA